MELLSSKNSKRDRIMRSKSFKDAGGERDRSEGSGRVKRLFHLMCGNIEEQRKSDR